MPVRFAAIMLAFTLIAAACGDDATVPSAGTEPTGAPAQGGPVDLQASPDRPLDLGDPTTIAPLDLDTLVVDAASIVFDTFDGGSVTLDDATPDTIERLLDAIAPIDAPDYEPAQRADWLEAEDVVLGYVDDGGGAWAYPVRVLNSHEIVNDQFTGVPVLVSYCPLCGSGVVFDRRLGGQTLSFSNTSALHENDLVMVDRETGSYWWQVPGRSLGGPLAGQELAVLSSRMMTWKGWVDEYPDTQVMVRPPGRSSDRDPFVGYADRVDGGSTPFPVSGGVLDDDRLSPGAMVLVATVDGVTRAWPVEPARTVTDRIGDIDVTVTVDGTGGQVVSDGGDGLPTRTSMWFAVVASFPDVAVGP